MDRLGNGGKIHHEKAGGKTEEKKGRKERGKKPGGRLVCRIKLRLEKEDKGVSKGLQDKVGKA